MPMTRISESDHKILQALANQTGRQHQEIIHEALDTYQRERLLDEIYEGFGRLSADKSAWSTVIAERQLLEGAGGDGLED
jgi:hypothetical protein